MGKLVENIMGQIKKLNDDESRISLLSELDPFGEIKFWYSTGVPGLNNFLNTPGFPSGNVIEISGKEQSGKTTLMYHNISAIQRTYEDILIVILATERRTRSGYPSVIGVKEEQVIVERPKTIEKVFSVMEYWIDYVERNYYKKLPLIFIWDSLGGTVSKAEKTAESDKEHMAVAARVIKKNIRRIIPDLDDFNVTFLIINQIYDKMSSGFSSGKRTTTYGGRSVKFHSSIRLQLTDIGQIKLGDVKIGQRVLIEILKSDFSPPNRSIEMPLLYGFGFVPNRDDLIFAAEKGLLDKYKTGYICTFNKKWFWKSEADYWKLLMNEKKFRHSLIDLLDIKYKNYVINKRKMKGI